MEFENMVLQLGARIEYFNPNTTYPSDYRNPGNLYASSETEERTSVQIKADPKINLSISLTPNEATPIPPVNLFNNPSQNFVFTKTKQSSYHLASTKSLPISSKNFLGIAVRLFSPKLLKYDPINIFILDRF